jgi:hypothetical protein
MNEGERRFNKPRPNQDEERMSDSESDDLPELPPAPNAPNHPVNEGEPQESSQLPQGDQYFGEQEPELEMPSIAAPPSPQASVEAGGVGAPSPPYSPGHREFEGCSRFSDYIIQKKIGSGTFGEVSVGIDRRTGRRIALKKILIHNEKEGVLQK